MLEVGHREPQRHVAVQETVDDDGAREPQTSARSLRRYTRSEAVLGGQWLESRHHSVNRLRGRSERALRNAPVQRIGKPRPARDELTTCEEKLAISADLGWVEGHGRELYPRGRGD